jgi:hypothetical protein
MRSFFENPKSDKWVISIVLVLSCVLFGWMFYSLFSGDEATIRGVATGLGRVLAFVILAGVVALIRWLWNLATRGNRK